MFESSPRMYVMFFKKEMSVECWVINNLRPSFQTKQRGHSMENIYKVAYLREVSSKFPSNAGAHGEAAWPGGECLQATAVPALPTTSLHRLTTPNLSFCKMGIVIGSYPLRGVHKPYLAPCLAPRRSAVLAVYHPLLLSFLHLFLFLLCGYLFYYCCYSFYHYYFFCDYCSTMAPISTSISFTTNSITSVLLFILL